MFGFMMPGPTEMIIVGIIAVLLFGSRLPSTARNIGQSLYELKRGLNKATGDNEDVKA